MYITATNFFKSDFDHLDAPQPEMISTDEEEGVNEETIMVEAGVSAAQSDEEEDYGYQLGGDSGDKDSQEGDKEELDDEDFGPEDNGGAEDPDMEALSYAEL